VFANVMGRFTYLKLGLAVVLSFVGVKMVLADSIHIPTALSLGVIALILTVAIVASMLCTRRLATRKGEPEAQASDTSTREMMPRR
jgi:tellurite resistance protein TerC